MAIAFDIETMRNGELINQLPEPEVKTGNLKDPAKIADKIAEAKAEQVDRMALDPLTGRVCAAVLINDNIKVRYAIDEDSDNAEASLLEEVFPFFSAIAQTPIITYNGTGFDLPFVYRRAVILGIDPREFGVEPLSIMTARYNNRLHFDLMTAWCGYGKYEKLDNISRFLLDDQKIEIDFREFPELIKSAEGRNKLLDYCEQDVKLTWALYQRFQGVLI